MCAVRISQIDIIGERQECVTKLIHVLTYNGKKNPHALSYFLPVI